MWLVPENKQFYDYSCRDVYGWKFRNTKQTCNFLRRRNTLHELTHLVEGNLNVASINSLSVHHCHCSLSVSFTSKPDDTNTPVLHLCVLDVSNMIESVLQHLPGGVHGQVPDHDSVTPPPATHSSATHGPA